MSGVAARAQEKKIADLQPKIDELASRIDQIRISRSKAEEQRLALASEREGLIVPARANGDEKARLRIRQIDEELAHLAREAADDEFAIAALEGDRDALIQRSFVLHWEMRRSEVREMIEDRLRALKEAEIEKKVKALVQALRLADEKDEQIAAAVLALDPSLKRDAHFIQMAIRHRGNMVGLALEMGVPGRLPIDSRLITRGMRMQEIDDNECNQLSLALASLSGLELVQ